MKCLILSSTGLNDSTPIADYIKSAAEFTKNPPSENIAVVLARIRAIAMSGGFTVSESSQSGINPVNVVLSGFGQFRIIGRITSELHNNPAIRIDHLEIYLRDDLLLQAQWNVSIRSGPWQGPPLDEQVEPDNSLIKTIQIRAVCPFPEKATAAPLKNLKPVIRYLGYFGGKDSTSMILEEDRKNVLLEVGEISPSGNKVIRADENQVELEYGGRERCVIYMKK